MFPPEQCGSLAETHPAAAADPSHAAPRAISPTAAKSKLTCVRQINDINPASLHLPGDGGVRSQAAGLLWPRPVLRGPEAAGGRPVRSARPPGERRRQ